MSPHKLVSGVCMYYKSVYGKAGVIFALLIFALLVVPAIAQRIYIRGIDPPEGYPGMRVRVYGAGATPNGTVVAVFDGFLGNETLGWSIAYEDGSWEIVFVVPKAPDGYYTVYVIDNETLTSDSIMFHLLTVSGIKIKYISPQSGPVGTIVYISGDGATAKGTVALYFDGILVANATAYEWGSWSASFRVPEVKPGNYTIKALDVISNTTDTVLFTVTPPPSIYVYPSEGRIGDKIMISGERFPPKTGIYIFLEDLLLFSPIATDENGRFNVTLFVPMVNAGNYTLKAISTGYPYELKPLATANFTVTVGLDTLISRLSEMQRALDGSRNETQRALNDLISNFTQMQNLLNQNFNETKNTLDEARASKQNSENAKALASEARTYALTAAVFAIITTALSVTTLIRKRK